MIRRELARIAQSSFVAGRVFGKLAGVFKRTLVTRGVAEMDIRNGAQFVQKTGKDLIHDPTLSKGTSFSMVERDRLSLRGLLPPRVTTIEDEINQVRSVFDKLQSSFEKYRFLMGLQDRNETLFYRFLTDNIEELAPIVYTPTVGDACLEYGHIYRRPRGMFFSPQDRNDMLPMVYNWPSAHVDVIVVTDGGRILGLGDLGSHGMGIPVGKLNLYTAAGGIHPGRVLPVMLDFGTNNKKQLEDPTYIGNRFPKIKGSEYYELVDEFIAAVRVRWPDVLIQFEDFTPDRAPVLLKKYRTQGLSFNDDIQGTGAVVLAGLLNAMRAKGYSDFATAFRNERIMVVGNGAAGIGVADTIRRGMESEGLSTQEAASRFWVCGKDGLVTAEMDPSSGYGRTDLPNMSLADAVARAKPTILLGLSGAGRIFTDDILRMMGQHSDRPVIFPLSNPTSKSEASAEDVFHATDGRAIFASGSPFDPVCVGDRMLVTNQCNNMYIFPGVGLGAVVSVASQLSDNAFYSAAKSLAGFVSDAEVRSGKLFPELSEIRNVSVAVASGVIRQVMSEGVNKVVIPQEKVEVVVRKSMYNPQYMPLVYVQ